MGSGEQLGARKEQLSSLGLFRFDDGSAPGSAKGPTPGEQCVQAQRYCKLSMKDVFVHNKYDIKTIFEDMNSRHWKISNINYIWISILSEGIGFLISISVVNISRCNRPKIPARM